MYGVEYEQFMTALCKPRVRVGTEWVNKAQNAAQVSVFSVRKAPSKVLALGQLGSGCDVEGDLQPHLRLARRHVQQDARCAGRKASQRLQFSSKLHYKITPDESKVESLPDPFGS